MGVGGGVCVRMGEGGEERNQASHADSSVTLEMTLSQVIIIQLLSTVI